MTELYLFYYLGELAMVISMDLCTAASVEFEVDHPFALPKVICWSIV